MKARYVFEHIMIPYLLDRRGGDFVSVLLLRGANMMYGLCRSAYEKNGEEPDFLPDDFKVDAARLDEKTVCVTVDMPEPKEDGDCKKIYILSDADPFYASFFTVERSGGGLALCGQSGDVRLTFGEYADETKALELILGVHKDNKKTE